MKLQAKTLLLIAPFILAPLLTLGVVSYSLLTDAAESDARGTIQGALQRIEQQFADRLAVDRANVELLSGLALIERYLLVEDEFQRYEVMQPTVLAAFAGYQRVYSDYYEIRLVLPDGYEDTRSALGLIPNATEEEGDSAWFKRVRASRDDIVTQITRNPDNGDVVLMVSRRIALKDRSVDPFSAPEVVRGYLVVTRRLDSLRRETALGSNAGLLVLATDKSNGTVLFSPEAAGGQMRLPPVSFEQMSSGARDGSEFVLDVAGIAYLMRGASLHDDMLLFVGIAQSYYRQATRLLGGVVAAVTFFTILLVSSLLFVALRKTLLIPLARLGTAAQAIGRGETVVDLDMDRADEIGDLAASFEDMGRNLARSNDQIKVLAFQDALTGLPNRRMFTESLGRSIDHAQRHGENLAVMFLDIDDFKRINDSLGHDAGDQLLCEIAGRLTEAVRTSDLVSREAEPGPAGGAAEPGRTVARVGGDEFIVLLPHLRAEVSAGAVAQRFLGSLGRGVELKGGEYVVGASIGIATYPQDGVSAEQLMKNADAALYHAKSKGKNTFQFFTADLNTAAVRRLELESALRRAVERGEFRLVYQAKVHAGTRELAGAEALLRWNNPGLGLVPPDAFIPVAEETGQIVEIGDWVLNEACRQTREWLDAGLGAVPVSVNVSSRQLLRGGFQGAVDEALGRASLDAAYLEVELTETGVIEAGEAAESNLDALRARGVRIAMDDFGTGYSSLAALKRLPIDTLKIDRRFVQEVTLDHDDAAIITTIIAMGRSLKLDVVAEGVETEEQMAFLQECGCDQVQGYLICRPLEPDAFAELLAPVGAVPA